MGKPINTNPKSTQYNKPVDSLIQYQGRDCVLDLTVDEATELMEVYRDAQNHVTIKSLNDKTKEQVLEIAGNAQEKALISLTKGTNGTVETTKITIHQDSTKENVLTFTSDTPNYGTIIKSGSTVTLSINPLNFGVYETDKSTSISFWCNCDVSENIILINDGKTSSDKINGVYDSDLNITTFTLTLSTVASNNKIAYFYHKDDENKAIYIINYEPYLTNGKS